MLKYRFMPYIVGGCVVVLLGVAYLSYVNYKADQNHKEWLAEMTAFQRSIEGGHDHSSHPHIHHGEKKSTATKTETREYEGDNPAFTGMTPDGDYSYDIAGLHYISETPMSQRSIEIQRYLITGEMTPAVKSAMRGAQMARDIHFEGKVIQTVLGPDGQRHQVLVNRYDQYEEGDTILESELNNPLLELAAIAENPRRNARIITDEGEIHYLPAEYFAIEDPYEQEEYFKKFDQSIQLGTSIAEIEKMIAAGKLDLSLTELEKDMIDQQHARLERSRPFSVGSAPLSDKPPVKVRFAKDDGIVPQHDPGQVEVDDTPSSEQPLSTGALSPKDLPLIDTAPVRKVSESESSSWNVPDIEQQLTPEGIESDLTKGLSADRFDKAQQLIDQYGAEEGLRRLREMDPEAARRFESDKSRLGQDRIGAPSRDVPDGGQSESGSKN